MTTTDELLIHLTDEYGPERGGMKHNPELMALVEEVGRLRAALARARRLLDHGIEQKEYWDEQDAVCALLDTLCPPTDAAGETGGRDGDG